MQFYSTLKKYICFPIRLLAPAPVPSTYGFLWNNIHQASVQFSSSVMSDSEKPWTVAHQASLSITNLKHSMKIFFTILWYEWYLEFGKHAIFYVKVEELA